MEWEGECVEYSGWDKGRERSFDGWCEYFRVGNSYIKNFRSNFKDNGKGGKIDY